MLFAKLINEKISLFSSFAPYREWKRHFASIFEKKFLFLHHIGTATGDFMTKAQNFFLFLLPHHICPANSCLLSWKRENLIFSSSTSYRESGVPFVKLASKKKLRFLLSTPYLSADCPNNDFFGKILKNVFQSKNTVRFLLYGGVYPVLYIRFFQFQ